MKDSIRDMTVSQLSDGLYASAEAIIGEFGIVANVIEVDRVARTGAKSWLAGGTGGAGWQRFIWLTMARGGRHIEKWIPTHRMGNFRAAWVPEPLRGRVVYMRGTREEMEQRAKELNDDADWQRRTMVNRRNAKVTPTE